ncbi:glycoside hydrolase family 6 protein [Demequina oxidasica]|uniref:glycoside hydrolase family 6 protein n=1 Tax=Demequina oxidasica TaxID=676199 RepID=UPI0007846739|nr:glycoside hydrolase family 6 protein [Demequina oxidasica]
MNVTKRAGLVAVALIAGLTLALTGCTSEPTAINPTAPETPATANAAPAATTSAVPPLSISPTPKPTETSMPNDAQASATFYNAPKKADAEYQRALEEGRDDDAALLKRLVDQPTATWLGDNGQALNEAAEVADAAKAAGQIPLFVLYAIPGRDCGLYSAGGLPEEQYLDFATSIGEAIEGSDAWVILEPDALPQLGDCDGQGDRVALLAGAAKALDNAGAKVFLDVGHSTWLSVSEAADRIGKVGTEHLTGFATNTSNYNATADESEWADQVGHRVGLPFVVDTSRNGNGSNGEWCNPRGRAIGDAPEVLGGDHMIATVWTKVPGESDGTCNGGPAAGAWWEEIALELVRNAQ